ncbi:hypothetical protein [Inediibacterium massiliense]|uniref:hypothetical protein n=1 Tax=Inediibacterium massiliense TaxID=1658111 RepID=UPI0006B40DD5|nr:hypothetical protein [Inediibacterium massiliense]
MKNKKKGIALVLIIVFLVANYYFHIIDRSIGENSQNNKALPLNTSYEGVSIFYDTLKSLEYSVAVQGENFLEHGYEDIYIITEGKYDKNFDIKKAQDWIKNGGKLIYLTEDYKKYSYSNILKQYKDKAYLYQIKKGKLLIGDINLITNKTLFKNKEGAYFILNCIKDLNGNIYFNEYYRFEQGEYPSLYKNLPIHIKIVLFQILLLIIGVIWYLGKRFGKAKEILDEIERGENEYLYAAANLYEKAGWTNEIYHVFYKEFENEYKKNFKQSSLPRDWIDVWKKNHLSCEEEAMRVFQNKNKDIGMIYDLDKMTQMLIKRREGAWKKLKQRNL